MAESLIGGSKLLILIKLLYSVFDNKATETKNKLKNLYFNNITSYLSYSYGTIESKYLDYLNKKHINDKERIRMLPEFLKEIQINDTTKFSLKKSILEYLISL